MQNESERPQKTRIQEAVESKQPTTSSGHDTAPQRHVDRPMEPPLSHTTPQRPAAAVPEMPTASRHALNVEAAPTEKHAETKSETEVSSMLGGLNQWEPEAGLRDTSSPDASILDDISSSTTDVDGNSYRGDCVTESERKVPKLMTEAGTGGAGNSCGSTEDAHVNATNSGNEHQTGQLRGSGMPTEHAQSKGLSVKVAQQVSAPTCVDKQAERCDGVETSTVQAQGGSTTAERGQTPNASPIRHPGRMSALFKSKAMDIVHEKSVGKIARFATKALADSVAEVERCVPSESFTSPL